MVKRITKRPYGTTDEGQEVTEYSLTNSQGLLMKVINYGCTITALMIPDRHGVLGDIVLGFDQLEGYLQSDQSIGCVVGRYANRIAEGKFSIAEKEYQLGINLPPHHLHGGQKGFGKVVWDTEEVEVEDGVGILFRHLSPDGHEGYPGNLKTEVKYVLSHDNKLSIEYRASTDQDTIINLTQHTYFNLHGGPENILDHEMTICADYFLPVDDLMIPTGEIRRVAGTPFDFTKQKPVGLDIDHGDDQLAIGHGYDHCWVLNRSGLELNHAATLKEKRSGRIMDVFTTEPGMQVYTANFLHSPLSGKRATIYGPRSGICLETQHYPDAPNQPSFPSVLLSPGREFTSKTILVFSIQ